MCVYIYIYIYILYIYIYIYIYVPETLMQKNNMGIIGNDMRSNKIIMCEFLGSPGRNNW